MKILQVNTYFYPVMGGLERVVYFLSNELVKLGHEVHIYTTDINLLEDRKLKTYEEIDDLFIHRVPSVLFLHSLEIPNPIHLSKNLKFSDFDVVHIHYHTSLFNIAVLFQAYLASVPSAVGLMAVNYFSSHPNPIFKTLGTVYESINLALIKRMSKKILVKSKRDLYRVLETGGIENIEFLEDGIPNYSFQTYDDEIFRQKYGVTSENIVLFVGRMHEYKGPQVLIESSPLVLKDYPDTTFIFMGPDQGMMSFLKKRIRYMKLGDKVKLPGLVSEEDKLRALSSCDMVVVPSLYDLVEVYSLVVSEAWAQSKPVIVSNIGELPYRVKNGSNGLIVPPNNRVKLANAIKLLLGDKDYGLKLGREGRKSIHTWQNIAKKAERIYMRIC